MLPIDQVQLHFNPVTLGALNFVLALVMFGVAIDLRVEDFREAIAARSEGRTPQWKGK